MKVGFFSFDTWRCPNPGCKYIITNVEMQHARFNYECPRCRKASLSNFILQLAELPKCTITATSTKSQSID